MIGLQLSVRLQSAKWQFGWTVLEVKHGATWLEIHWLSNIAQRIHRGKEYQDHKSGSSRDLGKRNSNEAWQIQDATPCRMPGIYVLQALTLAGSATRRRNVALAKQYRRGKEYQDHWSSDH